jgi:two-component system, OmpR family, sensor histidine kinase CreC
VSTTTRILIAFLLIVAGAYYVLLDQLSRRVERQYMEAAEEPMVDIAHVLAAILEPEFTAGNLAFANFRTGLDGVRKRRFEARIYNLVKTEVGMNAYVTDQLGRVLYDSRGGMAEGRDYSDMRDVALTLKGLYGARSSRFIKDKPETSVMYVAAPIRVAGRIAGVVTIIKPQSNLFSFIEETIERIHFYGWVAMLGTMLIAVLVSHWFSSPIRRLTNFARAVCRGERVAMPRLASPDVRTLAVALDEMRDSLEDRRYVEQYVQTLTHEMKSPVAAIRGAVELLGEDSMPAEQRAKFLANIASETDRLQNNIDRLLALSAIESMKALTQPEAFDLAQLIRDTVATHQHALDARNLRIELNLVPDVTIHGEAFLLEIAIGNLLQNAIDFTSPGHTITINLVPGDSDQSLRIQIDNNGPPIPDYALTRVFERFYSLQHPATGRKSSGLGLCFVREAAELHNATACLENLPDHQGVRATITFPG